MKALVTGGGGFLGGAIVRKLRARGDEVRSFARSHYPWLAEVGVEQQRGDLADAAALVDAAAGCDVVFHVAAKAGVWGPLAEYRRVNVLGTENVLAACRRHGIRRLVYTSSPSVVYTGGDMEGVDESAPYPAHFDTAYPQTKAEAERRVRAANGPDLMTVALRPHLIWGAADPHLIPRILARARSGRLRRIGREDKRVDCIYVDNAADAHVLAADRLVPGAVLAGRAYFLSQGEPVFLWDFINRILQAAGLPPVTRSVPVGVAVALGGLLEWLYRLPGMKGEPPMTRFVARQLSTAHWFDIAAARKDLGYVPVVSTEEGLRRLAADWASAPGQRPALQ